MSDIIQSIPAEMKSVFGEAPKPDNFPPPPFEVLVPGCVLATQAQDASLQVNDGDETDLI